MNVDSEQCDVCGDEILHDEFYYAGVAVINCHGMALAVPDEQTNEITICTSCVE